MNTEVQAEEGARRRAIGLLLIAARRGHIEVGVVWAAERDARYLLHRKGDTALLSPIGRVADQAAPVPDRGPDIALGIYRHAIGQALRIHQGDEGAAICQRTGL